MREYFQSPPSSRPRVFGMTASPIWNPKNAAESLATLERNLDAKVIAVKEHVDELSGHAPRPEEVYTSTHTLCTVEDDHAIGNTIIPRFAAIVSRVPRNIITTTSQPRKLATSA